MPEYLMKGTQTLILLALGALTPQLLGAQSSELAQLEHLRSPKISNRKNERMLVVEARGDPNLVGADAFALLFRLYYAMKETPKGLNQSAPRARWPVSLSAPKSTWVGFYGLPVPESVTAIPSHEAPPGLKASLTTWEYGDVAEILHVGPYDKEEQTIRRLVDFVKLQGYVIVGDHEEEYIKGPTMAGKGDPETYLTIIRYLVRKPGKN